MTPDDQISAWDALWTERARRLEWLREKTPRWEDLRTYYRTHISDFVNDWGVTFDPRNPSKDLPSTIPFSLDPKQREWCEFTFTNWRDGKYAGTEKSRDVGVSWLLIGMSIAWCTLYDGFVIGWGSYKSDKVDESGNMGSLFEKGRVFLDGLPEELRSGYEPRNCSFTRRLLFPHTGSSIVGEIGDNVGRGNRTSIYFVDEAAYFEHPQTVDAALSKTTTCRQDVSSVKGMSNTFAERMHSGKHRKFTFHWRDNPRFTQKDYDDFVEEWGPVITAQELDINYQASVEGVLIPAEWVNACIDAHLALGLDIKGAPIGSFDVADRGIDKNCFLSRRGPLITHCESWTGKESDIYASTERVFRLCDEHECRTFKYDGDGLGAGVRGDARKINENRRHKLQAMVFRGSADVWQPEKEISPNSRIKNKDFFYNAKAQAYWMLRLRAQATYRAVKKGMAFKPEDVMSIPSDLPERSRMVLELSQPTYSQNSSGLILVNKQPDGVASPNHSDAAMMSFAPVRVAVRIADALLEAQES